MRSLVDAVLSARETERSASMNDPRGLPLDRLVEERNFVGQLEEEDRFCMICDRLLPPRKTKPKSTCSAACYKIRVKNSGYVRPGRGPVTT